MEARRIQVFSSEKGRLPSTDLDIPEVGEDGYVDAQGRPVPHQPGDVRPEYDRALEEEIHEEGDEPRMED